MVHLYSYFGGIINTGRFFFGLRKSLGGCRFALERSREHGRTTLKGVCVWMSKQKVRLISDLPRLVNRTIYSLTWSVKIADGRSFAEDFGQRVCEDCCPA